MSPLFFFCKVHHYFELKEKLKQNPNDKVLASLYTACEHRLKDEVNTHWDKAKQQLTKQKLWEMLKQELGIENEY